MRRLALTALAAFLVAGVAQAESHKPAAPQLLDLRIDNGSTPFAGDSSLLTTVSPNGDGFRDVANVDFTLSEPATVTMEVTRTVKKPVVLALALAGALVAALKRRRGQADAALWREATSDSSR